MRGLLLVLTLGLTSFCRAETSVGNRVNPVFSDGVVLQRDRPVRIWGVAQSGERVAVEFAGQRKTAAVGASGKWMVELDPMPTSKEPRVLKVRFGASGVEQVVSDVLVGEVWICSGQSNMDCPIWGPSPRYRDAWGALTVSSTVRPHVRLAKTPKSMAATPQDEVSVSWQKMTPELMRIHECGGEMPSAVGYYYALELANALDVPIGMIDTSWGGTHIDTWVPRSGYDGIGGLEFERDWKVIPLADWSEDDATGMITGAEEQPTALWNAMVNPYAPLAVRGFIWYQGCQNVEEPHRYAAKMHALYNGWAREFRNPDMRLYFVQLAPWGDGRVVALQEAQARFALEEKNAAMTVINDVGNLRDIHPNDKRTVAKRLALHALKRDYGCFWLKDDSPKYCASHVRGNVLVLSFDGAEGWYVYNPDGSMRTGFELCGDDGKWRPARILNRRKTRRTVDSPYRHDGVLDGKDIELRADGVERPCGVRYLHERPWFGSLYNEVGLPLGAFHAEIAGRSPRTPLDCVDTLIGTEGSGSQYGGMMPYTGVPFGSFHLVPMTRMNGVGRLSFNQADDTLLGFILTRQPAIWMGDWGAVRVPIEPKRIESHDYRPYLGKVTAGGKSFEYTATAHAAWIRGDLGGLWLPDGFNANRDDANLGYELPNFRGWRHVVSDGDGMKIGVSLISLEQAKANLERELGGKTFEEVVAGTRARWEDYFSRISVEAPEDVRTIFYTGLFHTLLYPRQIGEYGRYYSAFDDRIHDGDAYSCYSLWDTYRAEHPWLTLIAPERVDGMMQSLLQAYGEGGWLPKWPNPGYTGIMIGAPAEIVLAEAYVKGFRGFDRDVAYEAVRKNALVPQDGDRSCDWRDRGEFGRRPETRGGLSRYMELGYVACDETRESVSRTQDFGFADRAAAVLADATGHSAEAAAFRARAKNFTNLWCAADGMFLPRRSDGTFLSLAEARTADVHYCEQKPETGVWAVPFDPEGLAELMGGKSEAVRRLDGFFDMVFFRPDGRGNGSIHGNETSHQCAYLYNRFGAPEKTQERVRQILTKCYSTNRKGFDGNEDCGQMSAWYILSALGFYPLDPVSGEYEIGSPIVRSAVLRFADPYPAAELRIAVRNYAPDRWRVSRVLLNGRELSDWRVRHADLVKGGELIFEMETGRQGGKDRIRK